MKGGVRTPAFAAGPDLTGAACAARGIDPELFFPVMKNLTSGERAAQALCRNYCPVRVQCLAAGKRAGEFGIWGGEVLKK